MNKTLYFSMYRVNCYGSTLNCLTRNVALLIVNLDKKLTVVNMITKINIVILTTNNIKLYN